MQKINIPAFEFTFSYSRSSGPGGQNVNKVNTKATLHWNAFTTTALPSGVYERFLEKYAKRLNEDGVLTLVSQAHRSQNLNTADVIEKLYEMINAVLIAPKVRKATKPTRSSSNKRLNEKKVHGDKKKGRQEKF
jgi:ribosome-associated protein